MSNQPPPPPPPVVPVPDVESAHASLNEVVSKLEATIARGSGFNEDERNQRVDDEWSTIESFRHIVFVIDLWLGKLIRGEQDPFHVIGLPPHFVPAKFPGSSIDPDAAPTFEEARDVVRERLATLQAYVDGISSEELERPISGHAKTAGGGLSVIYAELNAHDHFINRDLNTIQNART